MYNFDTWVLTHLRWHKRTAKRELSVSNISLENIYCYWLIINKNQSRMCTSGVIKGAYIVIIGKRLSTWYRWHSQICNDSLSVMWSTMSKWHILDIKRMIWKYTLERKRTSPLENFEFGVTLRLQLSVRKNETIVIPSSRINIVTRFACLWHRNVCLTDNTSISVSETYYAET